MFLHDSLNADKFHNDRKLMMLRKGVISMSQFINLIDEKDGYVMFGPAIVDKTKIREFMIEWKAKQLGISDEQKSVLDGMTNTKITEKFNDLVEIFPEIENIVLEFENEMKTSTCKKCTENRFISLVVNKIYDLKNDDRDLGNLKQFIDLMIDKYKGNGRLLNDLNDDFSEFDVEWIKPESLVGIGYDLIDKLTSCFDCALKHIGRAKILFEEMKSGYPDYVTILNDELSRGNKDIEEFYLKYLDSCAQLDMGSSELIGNIVELDKEHVDEIIELANEIRRQRILFQNDMSKIPSFDDLRLKIKHLQIKIQKAIEK